MRPDASGASNVTRRRFIGFAVGAAAGAAVGLPSAPVLSELVAAERKLVRPPGGPETTTLSVCRLCPGGCGLRVRCVDGRPVKVDGNPLHPVSGGHLCPKGQAALQSLYHPDRIAGPLRRVGPRGSLASFERTTWDEALREIALRLVLLRRQERPESLVVLRGADRGIGTLLASRFARAFGTPNDVLLPRGDDAALMASQLSQGVRTVPAYDLSSAEYVLSFGGALLEGWNAPVHTMRAFGEFRQGRVGRRGKLVQVEPRLSPTAAAADEWIPVRPGTEGLLAMGVAGALVGEGLFDEEFVTRRTAGFDALPGADGARSEGLRELLAREYPLERVSEATGVSVNVILRLARELAAARPGLAIGPRRGPLLPGRLFDHLAARQLNALMGNVDGPGGLLLPEPAPLAPLAELADDPVAATGRVRPRLDGAGGEGLELATDDAEALAEALLSGAPYPTEALLLVEADPAFASFAPEAFERAIERVPLVVALAGMPGDTALLADWILPTAHFLESWDLDTNPPGVAYPAVSLAQPVPRAPLEDARPLSDALLELARAVGGPVAEAFPWRDSVALIREQVEGLFEARRGAVIGTSFDEAWVRLMERAGWWAPGYRTTAELWNRMREVGGWWDPFYDHWSWDRVLATDSGRYELRPDVLATLGAERLSRARAAEPPGAPPQERLLDLVTFEPLVVSGGIGAELPFLQELLDAGLEARWETWAELHPETAGDLRVPEGGVIRVATPHGTIQARARLTGRIVSGAVAIPVGLGRRAGGRWAQGVGANPLRLLSPARESVSGIPDPEATRVRVTPAAAGREARS